MQLSTKKILIASEKRDLWQAITDNSDYQPELIDLRTYDYSANDKIHLLLFDQPIDLPKLVLFRVNYLFSSSPINVRCIANFGRPIKLYKLLELINKYYDCQQGFYCFNHQYIFSQATNELRTSREILNLTARESQLISLLVNSPGQKIAKEIIKQQLWGYHPQTSSATIDVHLYQLKKKLPSGLLKISRDFCQLMALVT